MTKLYIVLFFLNSGPCRISTESGHDDRRLSPVPHGDPHLHTAPWTLCDNISWFISYHGKQPILGESRSCRSIRDPSLLADRTAKDLAYFLFHGASLSLFSFTADDDSPAGYAWLAWRLEKCRPYPRLIADGPCQTGAGKSIVLLEAAASEGWTPADSPAFPMRCSAF